MRILALVCVLAGVALLGIDARWVSAELGFLDPARVFSVRWFGAELAHLDVAQAVALAARWTPPSPLGLAWAGLAFLAGALGAARAQRRLVPDQPVGLGTRALLGLAALFAVSPWLLAFVVERTATSADLYLDLGDVARALGLGLVFVGLVLPRRARAAEPPRARPLSVAAAVLVAMLAPLAVSHFALDGEPLTNDGVSYQFQGEVFAQGAVTRPLAPLEPFFIARQIVPGARATSKYPPGHALLLAPGTALGFPRLLPWLLLGLSTFLVFALASRLGARAPDLAAWVFALSPMVVGVESLWLSHGTSLPMGLLFLYAWVRACPPKEGPPANAMWPLLAGVAIAIALAARPVTALALAVPTALVTLSAAKPRAVLLAVLGFLPGAAAFLAINHAITGEPFKTAYGLYAELASANDRYGLINLPTAAPYTAYNLARLSAWGLGFGVLGFALVLGWRAARPQRFAALTWAVPLSFIAFYALHRFQGIPWVGPLYLVEAWPVLALLVAGALAHLAQRFSIPRAVLVLALALGAVNQLAPHMLLARELHAVRTAPARLATAVPERAVIVFVPQDSGDLQKLFPLPPPAFDVLAADHIVPDRWPVFARDLGDANNRLLFDLTHATVAFRYDRARGALVELFRR